MFDWDVEGWKADWEALQLSTAGNWCIAMHVPADVDKIVCKIMLMGDQGEALVLQDPSAPAFSIGVASCTRGVMPKNQILYSLRTFLTE